MNLEAAFWIVIFTIVIYFAATTIASSSDSGIEKKDIDIEMQDYDDKFQDYGVAWTFANLCSVVGWIALISGVLFAFIGISQINNVVYGNSFLVKLTAMLPGLGIAASGLVMIVIGQISRATIDAATNSKEILEIMEAKSK